MEDKTDPQARLPLMNPGERAVDGRSAGGRPIRPAAAEQTGKTVEQVEAAALDDDERDGDQAGYGQADCDRNRHRRGRS